MGQDASPHSDIQATSCGRIWRLQEFQHLAAQVVILRIVRQLQARTWQLDTEDFADGRGRTVAKRGQTRMPQA